MKWLFWGHTLPIAILLSGCAAVTSIPSIAGFVGSGGVTLYKKATENAPLKAELVLVKFEVHHDTTNIVQSAPSKAVTPCARCTPSLTPKK